MKKTASLATFLLLAACGAGEPGDYDDYEALRKKASARCEELGFYPGSPEFYSCVGTQYTRLKQGN